MELRKLDPAKHAALVAGLFFTSRFTSAQPSTGTGYELRVIAACIIGGVSLFGGAGSIAGTFVGSAFMVVLDNAMTMAHISGYWKQAILGVIIIIAIIMTIMIIGIMELNMLDIWSVWSG